MPVAITRSSSLPAPSKVKGMAKLKSLWSPTAPAPNQVGNKEPAPVKQNPNILDQTVVLESPMPVASSRGQYSEGRSTSLDSSDRISHRKSQRSSIDLDDVSTLHSFTEMLKPDSDPDFSMKVRSNTKGRKSSRSASRPILMKRDPSLPGDAIDKKYLTHISYEKLRETARPLLQQLLVASFIVELLE
ncbi:UNVERIFIED_CONTAM: hypothetical protein HDU68_012726 [Siphonaria sp. JEL0065]|nr:hypothetical protein HDU68_012726 [Siphonaria sp. JEL0065]